MNPLQLRFFNACFVAQDAFEKGRYLIVWKCLWRMFHLTLQADKQKSPAPNRG